MTTITASPPSSGTVDDHPRSAPTTPRAPLTMFAQDLVAGGLAGVLSTTAVAPLERVKLLLQVQAAQLQQQQANNASIQTRRPYTGLVDGLVRVAREEGPLALWRGNLANALRHFPTLALNFAFKDTYRGLFLAGVDRERAFGRFVLGNLAAGGAAGATAMLAVYPLDVARTRLAADLGRDTTRRYRGLAHCLRVTTREQGLPGLYRGFGVSVTGIVVYRTVLFGGYDTLRDGWLEPSAPVWAKWLVAQAVTTVGGLAAYPFDTLRRRLMVLAPPSYAQKRGRGSLAYAREILREEGAGAFFKGAGSNIVRGAGGALVLVLYDELQQLLRG